MISSNSLLEMRESSSSCWMGCAGVGVLLIVLVLNCQGSGFLLIVVVLVVGLALFLVVFIALVGIDSKPVAITVTLIVSSRLLSNAAPQIIVASG